MRHSTQRGSALIEAALVLPVFALLLVSSVDIARSHHATEVATAAARVGAHRALDGAADLKASEAAAVTDAGPGSLAHATRVCACTPEATPGSCDAVRCARSIAWVRVQTQVEVDPLFRLPGSGPKAYALGEAWVRVQ